MTIARAATLGLVLLILAGAPAVAADDPPDMAAQAKFQAENSTRALQRGGQGRATFTNWKDTKFRNVRGNYKRFEIVNDRIVFCGEVQTVMPDGKNTGWVKFAYLPGDPPILVTPYPGLGLREVGPHVLRNVCETGNENWLSVDYTPYFGVDLPEGAFGG